MPTYPGYTFAGYPGNVSAFAGPSARQFGAAAQGNALTGGGLNIAQLIRDKQAREDAKEAAELARAKELAQYEADLQIRTAQQMAKVAREERAKDLAYQGVAGPSQQAQQLWRDAKFFDQMQGVDFRPVELSGHPYKNMILAGQLQGMNLGAPSDPWVDVYSKSAASSGTIVPEQLTQAGVDRRFGRG